MATRPLNLKRIPPAQLSCITYLVATTMSTTTLTPLNKVHTEINTRFNTESDIYAVFVDVSTERIQGNCGIAYF